MAACQFVRPIFPIVPQTCQHLGTGRGIMNLPTKLGHLGHLGHCVWLCFFKTVFKISAWVREGPTPIAGCKALDRCARHVAWIARPGPAPLHGVAGGEEPQGPARAGGPPQGASKELAAVGGPEKGGPRTLQSVWNPGCQRRHHLTSKSGGITQ